MKKITSSICFFIFLFIVSSSYGQYKVKGMIIYIDFSDSPAWVTPERLDGLINGLDYREEGAQRSIRKYWQQQSRGKLDFTSDIFFYRAPQTKAYYDTQPWYVGVEMQKGALAWVAANHPEIDWNSYTISDNSKIPNRLDDGYMQSLNFIYSTSTAGEGGTNIVEWTAPNGMKTQKSIGIAIHQWWDTTPVNISPVCHEMGHSIFGAPDTYDNDGSSNGTGIYSLMSAGAPEAEPFGGPFLAQQNFVSVIKATGGTQRVKLIADGDKVFQYINPTDPNEYFTIEARKKSTIGNTALSTNIGLIIWHSDDSVDDSNSNEDRTQAKHYKHSIEQADGKFDLEKPVDSGNRGDAGDMYVPGKTFTSNTTPNSKWWNNQDSGLSITNIQINGDEVSFDVTAPTPPVINPKISQAGWTLKSTDSQEDGAPATNAFDGNPSTIWHTRWQNNVTSYPHEIQINLGSSYSISGFELTSRDDRYRTKGYQIYVSTDGNNWGQAVSTGELKDSYTPQTVFFPAKTGQYLKFVCTSTTGSSNELLIVSEINIYGTKGLPVTDFNVSKNNINIGESVTFSDASSNNPTAWAWTFEGGTPATSTQRNPVVKYNNSGSYKATLKATNTLGNNSITKANVVIVKGSTPNPNTDPLISQSGWTLKSVDSEEAFCCVATKAFDGDVNTIWHTKWGDTDKHPHEIQINLGTSYSISAFEYTASSGANGRIKDYQIYVSTDGTNWGTAVATGQFTGDLVPQTKTFGAKTGQYLKLVAVSEINGNVWTTVAEINIRGTIANQQNWLSKGAMSIHYKDSEENTDPASNILDNKDNTIWHTAWTTGSPTCPHEVQINLGSTYSLSAMSYLPRQVGENGRIKNYEIYVSTNPSNWGAPVQTGVWPNSADRQTVNFTAKTGQYVRLVALSEVNDNEWTSISELNFFGSSVNSLRSTDRKTATAEAQNYNFTAYPNPTKGLLNVEIANEVNGKVDIAVLTISGSTVQSTTTNTNSSRIVELDLHQLPKGLYIVRLTNNGSDSYSKIIVE